MNLVIIAEDKDYIAVNKPAGLSIHPGPGHDEPSLIEILEKQLNQQLFLVHRLDRDTTGVIIVAKTETAKQALQKQFQKRSVKKTYLALVQGEPKETQAILDWPIARSPTNPLKRALRGGGKPALTEYKIIKSWPDYSLLEVRPKTGRTHQIRVHLAHLGNPIVGDSLYGKSDPKFNRQWLHASEISFRSPRGGNINIRAPLPADLTAYLDKLK